ncbi:MAG: transglycosylase SLT domain-containing protein [Gammaproteobacteria bacterium]|nr:transglycosylase SLT domain-containing protein [Gammaproteobacteria bacterium]
MIALLIYGCMDSLPRNIDDACSIFLENKRWFKQAMHAQQRWGVPPSVLLAIIHQESKFLESAKPPRKRILWIFPGPRVSSAHGYAQALDGTWQRYIQKTGNRGADRDDFADAVDFIGWYIDEAWRRNGIAKSDAFNQYLAYHEGHGGFARGSYQTKPQLTGVARQVQKQALRYQAQLDRCGAELVDRRRWWWPF